MPKGLIVSLEKPISLNGKTQLEKMMIITISAVTVDQFLYHHGIFQD